MTGETPDRATVEQVARQHHVVGLMCHCSCGWKPDTTSTLRGGEWAYREGAVYVQFTLHLADALASAGLLADNRADQQDGGAT